jgi:hypothetical protein
MRRGRLARVDQPTIDSRAQRKAVIAVVGVVEAVNMSPTHSMAKGSKGVIELVEGLGVRGDAHAGATVQHLVHVARDPERPNLRQVHLIHGELIDELRSGGFAVSAGVMGENITTRGVDLLALPRGTRLHLGDDAVIEITGLRNPCRQLDDIQAGLLAAVLDHDVAGNLVRKAGVMSIVLAGGAVHPEDLVVIELPDGPHEALQPV